MYAGPCGRANVGTVVRVGRAGYTVNDVGNGRHLYVTREMWRSKEVDIYRKREEAKRTTKEDSSSDLGPTAPSTAPISFSLNSGTGTAGVGMVGHRCQRLRR